MLRCPISTAALPPQNWEEISMWHLPAICEIILPVVSWVISVPNPIIQVPRDGTFQSLIVHAVMNDTRQANSPKSASNPEAKLSKFRTLATPSVDLCIVFGTRYHLLPGTSVLLCPPNL